MQFEDNSEILILLLQRWPRLTSGELGDSLGSFRYSVLGQLSWEDEADSGLDLAGSHSWLLVVASKVGSFGGDFVKDILQSRRHEFRREFSTHSWNDVQLTTYVDKGVHDGHSL